MNAIIEQKLKELWQASEGVDPDVRVVTHLLYAHKLQGTGRQFAKDVCRVGSAASLQMGAEIEGGSLPGEVPSARLPDEMPETPTEWVN